jgi:hypothetical protein
MLRKKLLSRGVCVMLLFIASTLLLTACTQRLEPPEPNVDVVQVGDNDASDGTSITCTDSDGENALRQGIVTITYKSGATLTGKKPTVLNDYCLNNKKLNEYTCEGSDFSTQEIVCEGSCKEGKCVAEAFIPDYEQKQKVTPTLEETKKKEFYNCFNGFRDTYETDIDCGGDDCTAGCGYGKNCLLDSDCADDLVCNVRSKKCSTLKH